MSDQIDIVKSEDKFEVEFEITKDLKKKPNCPSKIALPKVHTSSTVCRICQTNTVNENLISPCNCKGSMAYVHLSCLEKWLNQSSRSYCELCKFRYNAIETQRYRLFEGLRLWIRHPRNRTHVRSDIFIAVLLTLVTAGLFAVCLVGMEYFNAEGVRVGIQGKWIKISIGLFLLAVFIGYGVTIYMLVRDQYLPWYNWWRRTVNIKLLLPPTVPVFTKSKKNSKGSN